ncbi:sensor histidine kinase [Cytobacillus sp. Hz8]|uniref:sensor histidine kinase n=1 Tax=Cytobacillus sp. Hz8 TaxID=3347168 RepID=UPI0035D861CD
MSLLSFLKNKRYFILFYCVILSFSSLIIFFSEGKGMAIRNILYLNFTCLFFVCIYLGMGYVNHRRFSREINEILRNTQDDWIVLLPEAQNEQQKLFLQVMNKLYQDQQMQLARLHDEKRDQQEFIMSWIHEIKLPISASRLLMENSSGKSIDYLVDKFEDEMDKIEQYVEQALYYSRIDSFSQDYFISELSVSKVIRTSVKKYAKIFINKGIHLNIEEADIFVHSDSKWLGFIIDQILANSLKYTEKDGMISISFTKNLKEKIVTIEDNGVGICSEDIPRVFDKGFTGSIGRINIKSTGMGLYLAKQLTKKLGHEISIASEEGHYTKVSIHFPKRK